MHVISSLAGGGVERLLVKSLSLFNKDKFCHMVCCVSKAGIYESDLRSISIPYWVMNRRTRLDPGLVFQMAKLMRQQRVDIVHTLNFTANAWGRVAARIAGVPKLIAHERGTAWTENAIMRIVDRALCPYTDLWLANSQAAKIVLTQHLGLPAARIRVIYNGVPQPPKLRANKHSLRELLGLGPDLPLVGNVGRLDVHKGHIYLLRAISLVWEAFPSAHFVILGDGPLSSYLKYEAQKAGLFDNKQLHFPGFFLDAPEKMREFDLLVHPSIHESLGNVIIEAGFARLPVVASNVDGIPEVILDRETGILIDCALPVESLHNHGASPLPKVVVDGTSRKLHPPFAPSPQPLAQSIIKLLEDPQMRQKMGDKAHQRAQALFSLKRYVFDLENIYQEL
jgi:glycosyltransferase involved in cell wall biosynthesis